MAYDLVLGGEVQVDLATTQGWSAVRDWAAGLDVDKFGEVVGFVEHGLSEDIPLLISQAVEAMSVDPPQGAVEATIKSMLESLGKAPEGAQSAFVSDGMGPDDGSAGEWDTGPE